MLISSRIAVHVPQGRKNPGNDDWGGKIITGDSLPVGETGFMIP